MYTLKSVVRRGSLFGATGALLVATFLPAAAVFAEQALNPLTERSLLLSSSAPGFQDTDGSNYSVGAPNPAAGGTTPGSYAPAGSGPNGKKTGETFSFRVSTTSTVSAYSLQYCTGAAGDCLAPGNNNDGEDNATAHPLGRSDFDVVGTWTQGTGPGQFQILVDGSPTTASDWVLTATNNETGTHLKHLTGKKNYMTLVSASGDSLTGGDAVTLVFNPSESTYITNPGEGAFFVRMNTYDGAVDPENIVDGGVTVANVMTESIHITTKVLETMQFSVGTQNRDTVVVDCDEAGAILTPGDPKECEGPDEIHGTCDPIQTINANRLNLGNPNGEYSLEIGKSWDVNSYWRLSSNSSGGATVYYSGNTLANTVGDEIAAIGSTPQASLQGTEQFGLAFVDAGDDTFDAVFNDLVTNNDRYKTPSLDDDQLLPLAAYANGEGKINPTDPDPNTASFAFVKESNTVPEVIATNDSNVISCATAKMRYVANIAADTPAGVYTTKINYLAAPQY